MLHEFIESIVSQTEQVSAFGYAYLGGVLVTWASMIGITDKFKLSDFKGPMILMFPGLCFLLCVLLGMAVRMQVSGFYSELVRETAISGTTEDTHAYQQFRAEYAASLKACAIAQLAAILAGMIALGAWYVVNVWFLFKTHTRPNGGNP